MNQSWLAVLFIIILPFKVSGWIRSFKAGVLLAMSQYACQKLLAAKAEGTNLKASGEDWLFAKY